MVLLIVSGSKLCARLDDVFLRVMATFSRFLARGGDVLSFYVLIILVISLIL